MAGAALELTILGLAAATPLAGDANQPPASEERVLLSAPEMLAMAERALLSGDTRTAEAAYRALAADADLQIRSEARFRMGMMYRGMSRYGEAAYLFRQILDDQPRAQRVRLELARTLDLIGDEAGARRSLREAQAGGLPPAVARFVNRYSAALRAQRPFGASFEFAVAPDSNINRATRSDTLGTVLGDFALDEDAQQRSGVGLALRSQAYARTALGEKINLVGRISNAAELYRRGQFSDVALAVNAGPELRLGRDRLAIEAGLTWRWFGGSPYSRTASLGVEYLRPLDPQSQLRATAALAAIRNERNGLQNGKSYAFSLAYERALSSRSGIGATVAGERQDLRESAYSLTTGQLTLFGYREMGAMTVIASLGYGRVEAAERLFIYPRRRSDVLYRASLGATFRQLTIGNFAPLVRFTFERNRSSIELYQHQRLRTEFGLSRAF